MFQFLLKNARQGPTRIPKRSNSKSKAKPIKRRERSVQAPNVPMRLRQKQPINDSLDIPEDMSAENRVDALVKQSTRPTDTFNLYGQETNERDPLIKAIRWINPGTEKIMLCIRAMKSNSPLPPWAIMFRSKLKLIGKQKLALGSRLILTKEQKHAIVKRAYFDPKLPSTPRMIYDKYDNVYANLTRKNCENILKTIETYQLNF